MKYNKQYQRFMQQFGVDEIYNVQSDRFTFSTAIAVRGEQRITVSDILNAVGYLNDFIKANYDVTDKKYSETLLFLKTINLVFNNQNCKRPTKDCMHYAVDVIHEIADMQATCSTERRANAKIALVLNAMIDLFGAAQKPESGI